MINCPVISPDLRPIIRQTASVSGDPTSAKIMEDLDSSLQTLFVPREAISGLEDAVSRLKWSEDDADCEGECDRP